MSCYHSSTSIFSPGRKFLLDAPPKSKLAIDRETFALGCAPIINLFKKTTEPIRLDHRQAEYPLVADFRRQETTEVHTVLGVASTSDFTEGTQHYKPFYSFDHTMEADDHTVSVAGRAG